MTPKEKAKELVNNFIDLTDECDCLEYSCICFTMYEYKAKQCALIAVDEILNNSIDYNAYDGVSENDIWSDNEYWQEVKKEINEL
jgi:hypothetical protein